MRSDTISVWQLLLVTVGSGLASGLVVGLLQMSHERRERLRDRRITAADELATAFIKAVTPVRNVLASEPHDWEALSAEREAGYDETITHQARVDLLYGEKSATGETATSMIESLATLKKELAAEKKPPADFTAVRALRDEAADCLDRFTTAAHGAAIRTWPGRWFRWGN